MLALLAPVAFGQTKPASSQPATQPVVAVVPPPGFVRFEVGGRTFVALPDDKHWIEKAAGRAIAPAPATRPADMVDSFAARHDALTTTMLADLPALTPSQVDQYLNGDLLPLLKDLAKVGPRMVFLVAPAEHLKAALRAGWTDPRIHYNKVADDFEISRTIAYGLPGKTDESIVVVLFRPDDTEDRRVGQLSQYLTGAESDVQQSMANRATALMISGLANFVAAKALADLPRSDDQIWLADGLATVLATKYVSVIHGAPQLAFIRQVSMNPPNAPVDAMSIDLLHPQPSDQLLPQLIVHYEAARHRKDVAVMYLWLLRAGEKKIGPTLTEISRLKPADGITLAKALATASGVDLSADLAGK